MSVNDFLDSVLSDAESALADFARDLEQLSIQPRISFRPDSVDAEQIELTVEFWRGTEFVDVFEFFVIEQGSPTASRDEIRRWIEDEVQCTVTGERSTLDDSARQDLRMPNPSSKGIEPGPPWTIRTMALCGGYQRTPAELSIADGAVRLNRKWTRLPLGGSDQIIHTDSSIDLIVPNRKRAWNSYFLLVHDAQRFSLVKIQDSILSELEVRLREAGIQPKSSVVSTVASVNSVLLASHLRRRGDLQGLSVT